MKLQINISHIKNKLLEHHWTISTCESFTSGKIANTLCSEPGASQFFDAGCVIYSTEAKKRILKYTGPQLVKPCVKAMLSYMKKFANSNVVIATSGNAGPTTIDNKPLGYYLIGIQINHHVYIETFQSQEANRLTITQEGVNNALAMLAKYLEI